MRSAIVVPELMALHHIVVGVTVVATRSLLLVIGLGRARSMYQSLSLWFLVPSMMLSPLWLMVTLSAVNRAVQLLSHSCPMEINELVAKAGIM